MLVTISRCTNATDSHYRVTTEEVLSRPTMCLPSSSGHGHQPVVANTATGEARRHGSIEDRIMQ
jgi:hypothetical protein